MDGSALLADDRTLVRDLAHSSLLTLRFLLMKPDDVPTYVEFGAADLGVCGRDVLAERGTELYQPIDLGIGRCRMVVAGVAGAPAPEGPPRVATKYPRTAAAHFAKSGVQAEVITVQGSVELAPLSGLSDVIVDLVETGQTLAQNGLEVREEVAPVSSVLVVNRASYKLRWTAIAPLIVGLRSVVSHGA
jgi:ATP phosphoribosyltransferase